MQWQRQRASAGDHIFKCANGAFFETGSSIMCSGLLRITMIAQMHVLEIPTQTVALLHW